MERLRKKLVTEDVGSIYLILKSRCRFDLLDVLFEEMLIINFDTSLSTQQQQDLAAIESCLHSLFPEDIEEDEL